MFTNKVVCEGDQLALRCEANARLAVYSVLFGRTVKGTDHCPQPPNAPDEGAVNTCRFDRPSYQLVSFIPQLIAT